MSETATERAEKARQRILAFLQRIDRLDEPGAVMGGDDLPETTVFECVAETWPGREVVHVDSSTRLQPADIRDGILRSFQPNRVLLLTITRKADKGLFRYMEQLLVDGYVEVPEGDGWAIKRPPAHWRFVIHSRPGRFPMDETVDSKMSV